MTDKLDIQQVYTDLAYSEQVAHVGPRLLAAIPLLLAELHRLQKQRQTVLDLHKWRPTNAGVRDDRDVGQCSVCGYWPCDTVAALGISND